MNGRYDDRAEDERGYFEVQETASGFHIVIVGGNGEPIASGEVLKQAKSADDAIAAIRRIAASPNPVRLSLLD